MESVCELCELDRMQFVRPSIRSFVCSVAVHPRIVPVNNLFLRLLIKLYIITTERVESLIGSQPGKKFICATHSVIQIEINLFIWSKVCPKIYSPVRAEISLLHTPNRVNSEQRRWEMQWQPPNSMKFSWSSVARSDPSRVGVGALPNNNNFANKFNGDIWGIVNYQCWLWLDGIQYGGDLNRVQSGSSQRKRSDSPNWNRLEKRRGESK